MINLNSPIDSSHINAWVSELPLLINKPASYVGTPDWEPANRIIGSLTNKFSVLIVEVVPITIKFPLIVIVSPLSVILLLPNIEELVHFGIVFVTPYPLPPIPTGLQCDTLVASTPAK